MFSTLIPVDDVASLINQVILHQNVNIPDPLLQMDTWEMHIACAAVIGSEAIPPEFVALVREAVAKGTLPSLTNEHPEDTNWQFSPRTFLLWCRKNDIALRKPLSQWLDADTSDFARTIMEWDDWSNLNSDFWSSGILSCVLAEIPPVKEITYILHQYPDHTSMVLGCSPEKAQDAVQYYRLILSAIENKAVGLHESATLPNGTPRGFTLYREEIETWLEKQGVLLPEGLLESRQKLQNLAERRATGKEWVDLVNDTNFSRYKATSAPASLKKDRGYYQQKLVGIGLVTYVLLDMPYEDYQGHKTEQRLYTEWHESQSLVRYPFTPIVYKALREAVRLEEITPKNITVREDWELYEVSLKAALLWCSSEGVILDELMLAYIEKIKNDLPYSDEGLTSRATRKQQTINIRQQIKEVAPEIHKELVKQRGKNNFTKRDVAFGIKKKDFAVGMTIENILRQFSFRD
jgi:hypothetical protein